MKVTLDPNGNLSGEYEAPSGTVRVHDDRDPREYFDIRMNDGVLMITGLGQMKIMPVMSNRIVVRIEEF